MPPVVAFVAGIGAVAASLFGIGLIGIPAIIAGSAVLALTVAAARRSAKLDDPSDAGYVTGQQVSVRSTVMPRSIVYGESNVGGVFTYVNTTGTELRELYYELVHTGHEVSSYSGWWLDDKYVPAADVDVAGDGSVDTNTGGHGLDDVAAGPVLYLRGALGTDSQAVDSMLDTAFADIGTNHRHRGCARTVIRCDLLAGFESKWNGRAPQTISAVIKGKKVYDPRLDTTFPGGSGAHRLATPSTWAWSDNPALIWADYRITAKPLGPGWDSSRISYQSVFDAANACDVAAAIPTATTEKRFRCDLVVDTSMEPQEVIAQILASMFGNERQFGGTWHVYAGVWPTPDFALDESDLVGPIQYRKEPETSDRYNQIKGEFFDRDRQWKLSPFVTVNNTTLRTNRDAADILPKHLRLDGVSREYQAQRLALRALNQADDSGLLVFSAGYSAANIRVGDTGTVTISEFGWVSKSFRCVGVKQIDFLGYELKLKEDASGNYTDPAEGAYSTRTAAGAISFGTVMPWYLYGVQANGWVADTEGKPAGIRGLTSIANRSQLFLSDSALQITSNPDTVVVYGFPAIPIDDSKTYRLSVRYHSSATSPDGVFFGAYEKASAPNSGKTHIGASGGESDVVDLANDSITGIIGDFPMPGTNPVQQSVVYTPTAGTKFASISMGNVAATTANVELFVDWIVLSEVGSNVNVLPVSLPPSNTPDLNQNVAEVLVSSQPSDGTEVLPSISYSGGGTLVDYSTITSVSWENDTRESIDVVLRQSARVQLSASDSLIGRKLAMRWSLNGGGSWSYDGTNTDNINITAADWQPKATQRTVTVADGETIDAESIVVLIIPDPTSGDPADVQYRGLSLSVEAKLR